ncbi:MAG: SLBB domain-containing protein [Synergistaceae bacterium]|nr:SLBB domain-containing protein [Synergistaceae bacterium]
MKSFMLKKFCWITLIFALCTSSFAAEFGSGFIGGGSPVGGSAQTPGAVDIPSIPNAPSVPVTPRVPTTGRSGIDLSGLDSTRPGNNIENVDLTRGQNNLFQQDTNQPNQNLTQQNLLNDVDAPLSAQEIDDYFNQILSSRTFGSPMYQLMQRLPRYGMSFFRNPPSTYAPQNSLPVTQGYRINVGDEITLTLWGIPEEGIYKVQINRDGMATIPHIGVVRLAGYTLTEAERVLQSRLNQYYTGYQMNLSMGQLSSIMIYVTGNARRPGAYTVSSFSTLINALLASGGPSPTGSLRKIELKRNGQTIAILDMYAMLLQGDQTQDARLQAGDVIYIPPVGPLVGLAGEIQTPGVYELNGATRLKDLLFIAGGLNAQTFKGRVQYYRIFEHAYASALEGTIDELENTELQDGDIIRLYPVYNFTASATITGPLMRPGQYVIIPGRTKISEIVERAGGLGPTASEFAEVTRVMPSLSGPVNQRFTINIQQALLGDPENNMTLQNNDHITILMIPDWKQQIYVTINGEVSRPGTYAMFTGEKISDLIERAGGFTSKAFLRGSIFTRRSVAEEQRKAINRMADQMERDLLQSVQNTVSGRSSASSANATAMDAEFRRRRELINSLREMDIMGRVITKIDTPANIRNTAWDYELQNGDALNVPTVPITVNVMGAVYSSSSQTYRPNTSINAYVNAAGGPVKNAHKRMLYLLKSDGSTIKLTRNTSLLSSKQWTPPQGFSAIVEPGDTIVVPLKYVDRTSMEMLKDTIDMIYKVGTSTGVIINATRKN